MDYCKLMFTGKIYFALIAALLLCGFRLPAAADTRLCSAQIKTVDDLFAAIEKKFNGQSNPYPVLSRWKMTVEFKKTIKMSL